MGLCVPDDFGAIFLTDSSIPLHVRMTSGPTRASDEEKLPRLGESFEFHSSKNCLGCYRLRDDTRTLDPSSEQEQEPSSCIYDTGGGGPAASLALKALSLSSIVGSVEGWTEEDARKEGGQFSGTFLLRKEILRLVSNLICCVGAKANEQGLLRWVWM